MNDKIKEINDYLAHFCDADIDRIYKFTAQLAIDNTEPENRPQCPHCQSNHIIKWGFKDGKQRFYCKDCRDTFSYTTNTIMENSHYSRSIWREFISDTLSGASLDDVADKYGFSHQTAFTMRHKLLSAIEKLRECNSIVLGETCELDETFVLDNYKGRKLSGDSDRKPRKHGAKASKRGISNEYVCICAGVQRNDGEAIAKSVNRAKPTIEELCDVFGNHIADGSLVLTDGLRGYKFLETRVKCSVINIDNETNGSVYNLNNVNSFHSFIKERYEQYRGVATKYLNRYSSMFSEAFRNIKEASTRLFNILCNIGSVEFNNTAQSLAITGLLVV